MRAAIASLVLAALSASAAPSLTLSVSSPDDVVDVDNLKVKTVLKNTGDESVKVRTEIVLFFTKNNHV